MLLPGRLKDTTLGDLLGTLLRAEATGTLTLIADQGERHHILVRDGLVHEVRTSTGPRLGDLLQEAGRLSPYAARLELRLGEFLLRSGHVTPQRLGVALRRLHLLKLDCLFSLRDASIRFYVARPQTGDPAACPPLEPRAFLDGRPRLRANRPRVRRDPSRTEALQVLGLDQDANPDDIRRAFRALAQERHPDRHPELSSLERTRLIVAFSELSSAYHSLVG